MKRGAYCLVQGVLLLSCLSHLPVQAGRVIMPSEIHYEAAETGKNCSVYRTMVGRSRKEINRGNQNLRFHVNSLKRARDTLEACARHRGVYYHGGQSQEQVIAEICPEAYDEWLSPSYRVLMVKQDIQSAQTNLEDARSLLRHYCRALPKGVNLKPRRGEIF